MHESADVDSAERRWSEVTGIDRRSFNRTSLKRHNAKTTRYNTGDAYIGCLVIEVCRSTVLYQLIEGWWRGIAASGNTGPVVQT
jgi:hypothetical protein